MTGYPIQTPPRFTGSDGEKLTQCYAYLYQMSEELNLALASLLGQSESRERKRETAESRVEESMKSQYSALQTLITKNAGLVEAEMERLQLELKGRYAAASEFGRYVQELSQ